MGWASIFQVRPRFQKVEVFFVIKIWFDPTVIKAKKIKITNYLIIIKFFLNKKKMNMQDWQGVLLSETALTNMPSGFGFRARITMKIQSNRVN